MDRWRRLWMGRLEGHIENEWAMNKVPCVKRAKMQSSSLFGGCGIHNNRRLNRDGCVVLIKLSIQLGTES